MIRILISTAWSVLCAFIGLVVSGLAGRFLFPPHPHHGPRFGFIMAGLVIGLALFSALREAEILPGLGPRSPAGAAPEAPSGRRVKAFFIGTAWTLALGVLGLLLGYAAAHYLAHVGRPADGLATLAGFLAGLLAVIPLYRLGWLAGLGKARGQWGVAQAILLFLGFAGMQGVGQMLCLGVAALANRAAHGSFSMAPDELSTATALSLAAGYLAATWWAVWYIRRLGPARVEDGGVTGIGWRKAPRRAYLVAAGFLIVMLTVEAITSHVAPPHGDEMLIQHIFGTHGWKVVVLFIMAVGFAPAVEELVFRGGMFSALAGRCGTVGAAVITSLLFTVAHAQEYYEYWPGLFVIGVVAAALIGLRLQYGSIRPGIFLHVLFNAVGVLGMALSR
jgi:membrane protease YdiL (CAAX protease family)